MTAPLMRPKALLLDFGGVIATTEKCTDWHWDMAKIITDRAAANGVPVPVHSRLVEDLLSAELANSFWKNAMSRVREPAELPTEMYWGDFVAADWPKKAREFVTRQSTELMADVGRLSENRVLRPGMPELLHYCQENEVRVAIASNTLAGTVHREFIAGHNLESFFVEQCYSDELNMRKPHPGLLRAAADACGVDIEQAWYVGDTVDRDVVAARRAGAGASVTMMVPNKKQVLYPDQTWAETDLLVDDPWELLEQLRSVYA